MLIILKQQFLRSYTVECRMDMVVFTNDLYPRMQEFALRM